MFVIQTAISSVQSIVLNKTIDCMTRLFMCHDYPPAERDAAWEATVAEQRAHIVHVHDGIGEQDFVAMRQKPMRGWKSRC